MCKHSLDRSSCLNYPRMYFSDEEKFTATKHNNFLMNCYTCSASSFTKISGCGTWWRCLIIRTCDKTCFSEITFLAVWVMGHRGRSWLLITLSPPCDQPHGLLSSPDSFLPPMSGSGLPAYLCVLDQSSSHHKTKVEHKLKPTLFDDVIPRRVQAWLKITHRISQTDFGEGK